MRFYELAEATGGIARRWLEKGAGKDIFFLDKSGKRWDLEDVSFWPKDPALKYEPDENASVSEKIAADIEPYLQSKGVTSRKDIGSIPAKASSGAAIIVILSSGAEKFAYVKIVKQKHSTGPNPITWTNTNFLDATGLTVQTPQMKKASVPFDPSDIVIPGNKYSADSIIQTLEKSVQGMDIPEELKEGAAKLISNVKNGIQDPVPNLKEHKPVIEIKLGEIAAPVALVTGNFVSGAYKQAEDNLIKPLGGTGWNGAASISFPAKGELLVDSYLNFSGGSVGISSKDAKGGAKPSIKTVVDTITEKADSFEPKFFEEYADTIELLKSLNDDSAIEGVEKIALQLGIVEQGEIDFLNSIYSKGKVDASTIPAKLQELIDASPYKKVDYTHPEYQNGYHILAVLARAVTDYINKDKVKITKFFKAVLNKSNLVQVYAKAQEKDTQEAPGGLYFSNFNVVWPPVFDGTIEAYSGHYTSRTRPTRKISFGFN